MATPKVPAIEQETAEKTAAGKPVDALTERVNAVLEAVENGESFFIVNPAGAVHQVDEKHFYVRLEQKDYREATAEEIEAYIRQPKQIASDPIGFRELGNLKRRRTTRKSK